MRVLLALCLLLVAVHGQSVPAESGMSGAFTRLMGLVGHAAAPQPIAGQPSWQQQLLQAPLKAGEQKVEGKAAKLEKPMESGIGQINWQQLLLQQQSQQPVKVEGKEGKGEQQALKQPVQAPLAGHSGKQEVVNLPVIRAAPIIRETKHTQLPTETRPMRGAFSQPIQAPVKVEPIIVQAPIYSQNPVIVRQAIGAHQKTTPEVDTTVAPKQYIEALINKQHITQPILQPKIITQPITEEQLIERPIFRQHIVEQPIVRPVISQPVITPNLLEKITVQNQVTEQPIITPKVTEQTVIQPIAEEKQFQNQPITRAAVMGQKQHAARIEQGKQHGGRSEVASQAQPVAPSEASGKPLLLGQQQAIPQAIMGSQQQQSLGQPVKLQQ